MALTESEELELLELENENAILMQKQPASAVKEPSFLSKVAKDGPMSAIKDAMAEKTANFAADSPLLPMAGGVIGGLAGAPLGPGAVATAGLGGAAGESYRQILARSMGKKAPETSIEAAKDIGIEGATQAAGEGSGQLLAPVVKGAANMAKKPLGDLFQIVTKIKPEYAQTLFKNPKAILPGVMKEAKEAWRTAAKAAGIEVDEVSTALIDALKTDAKDTVYSTYQMIKEGTPITAGQAQLAKEALSTAVMPAAKNERNEKLIALLSKIKQTFIDRIGEESPALAKANKQYAIAKSGQKFRSLFPRNINDSPAYFRSSMLPGALGLAGFQRGETGEGILQGLGAGAASSPLAIGGLIALAGSGRGLVPYAGKTLTSGLAELARRRFEGR